MGEDLADDNTKRAPILTVPLTAHSYDSLLTLSSTVISNKIDGTSRSEVWRCGLRQRRARCKQMKTLEALFIFIFFALIYFLLLSLLVYFVFALIFDLGLGDQNAELFTLTYGAIVRQLLTDFEEVEEVNKQLDQM